MNVIALILAAYAFATPVPLRNAKHVTPALPPGAMAHISAQGNNVPCWESPAALSGFTQAYQAGDRASVAMHVANESILLEEGNRVRSLGPQGLLGQITRLKLIDGESAGRVCYVMSALKIYSGIRRAGK